MRSVRRRLPESVRCLRAVPLGRRLSNMSTKESIERLDAAVRALGEVDLADWSDATMRGHLDELSAA